MVQGKRLLTLRISGTAAQFQSYIFVATITGKLENKTRYPYLTMTKVMDLLGKISARMESIADYKIEQKLREHIAHA